MKRFPSTCISVVAVTMFFGIGAHAHNGPAADSVALRDSTVTVLLITSEPDSAEVYLGGVYSGRTPLVLKHIRPGDTTVVVTATGYAPYSDSSALTVADTIRIHASLRRFGSLAVETVPEGAEVRLDDRLRGVTPIVVTDLRSAAYQLQLRLHEHQQIDRAILIPEGDTLRLRLTMTSRYGTLSLSTVPHPATIRVDGDSIGFGSVSNHKLLAGEHDLEVSHPSYPPDIRQRLFVGPAADVRLVATMQEFDVQKNLLAAILPGSAQFRDDATLEGVVLSIGSAALVGLLWYHVSEYADMKSDYNRRRADYLQLETESEAVEARALLDNQFSALSAKRTLVVRLGALLGGLLTYNAIDVILNHPVMSNTLAPAPGPRELDHARPGASADIDARVRYSIVF